MIAPDGRLIAFIDGSRQELLVGRINGESPRRLAMEEEKDSLFHPAWSPDGRWIAYWRVTGWPRRITIEARPAGGGPAKTLVPGSSLPATTFLSGSMSWSPDWRLLFALSEASGTLIEADYDNDGIWDLQVEPARCEARGKPERLTPRLGWWVRNLTITADGKRLAFLKGRTQWDVWVGDMEKGGSGMTAPRRLTFDTRGSVFQGWTLDSQAILYQSMRNGKLEVFRHPLTFDGALPEVFVESSESVCCPLLTPDRSWLLYLETIHGAPSFRRVMRRPAAGGSPEMIFGRLADEWMSDWCPEMPGYPCEFSQRDGQDLVFYSLDPVRGKGDRLGKIEIRPNLQGTIPRFDWGPSLDGSRLGVVVDGLPRIAVLTLADRAWHEIPVPPRWGSLTSIGAAADARGFTVASSTLDADYILNVSAGGKVDLLLRKDWSEQRVQGPMVSPDGKHLAFRANTTDTNAWMIENF